MKHFSSLLMTVLALAWLTTACGPGIKVDTTKLEQSFQSAPAASKSDATKAAAAIKSGDYATAVASLQNIVKAGGLTPEQKDGVITAVTGMQMVAAKNQNKYPVELYNALSDLIALAEGQQPVTK